MSTSEREARARERIEAMHKMAVHFNADVASISGETRDGEPFAGIYAQGEAAHRLKRWIAADAKREREKTRKGGAA